jgi:adenosylmethionine-8-amino-7-oxononanoate aminotransferase
VLLIAEEVICGFGRTGRMFGTEAFGLARQGAVLGLSADLGQDDQRAAL